MSSRWRGRLFVGTGWLLYAGPVGPTLAHAHHAFQLVLPLESSIRLQGATDIHALDCTAAVIPPDTSHLIERGTTAALMLYVDPDTLAGRRLRACMPHELGASAWAQAGAALSTVSCRAIPSTWEPAEAMANLMLAALVESEAPPRAVHPAVARIVRLLPELLDGDVRIEALAAHVGLSASRLAHAFRAAIGIPLRPYILWLRLQRAVTAIQSGMTLTEAAHEAGFADGAHLTRSFRRMFGIAPSDVVGWAEWITPPVTTSK
jgi:AraC-like DNA-binding protein